MTTTPEGTSAEWLAAHPLDIERIEANVGLWYLSCALIALAENMDYRLICSREGLYMAPGAILQPSCRCSEMPWPFDAPRGSVPVVPGVTRCNRCGAKHGVDGRWCPCWEPITVDNVQSVLDELNNAVHASRSQGSA